MTTDSITVQVPHPIYERLEDRAQQTQRSVEEELVDALAEAVSLTDTPLPVEIDALIDALDAGSDAVLWQVARSSRLSPAAAAHLEELNLKRGREGLTGDERHMVDALVQQYERVVPARAEVMMRLKGRGQNMAIRMSCEFRDES